MYKKNYSLSNCTSHKLNGTCTVKKTNKQTNNKHDRNKHEYTCSSSLSLLSVFCFTTTAFFFSFSSAFFFILSSFSLSFINFLASRASFLSSFSLANSCFFSSLSCRICRCSALVNTCDFPGRQPFLPTGGFGVLRNHVEYVGVFLVSGMVVYSQITTAHSVCQVHHNLLHTFAQTVYTLLP